MEASTTVTGHELGDRLGDVLADRFLYHFVVRRLARRLLGEDDEWDGLPILPPPSDHPTAERGGRPLPA